MGRIRRCILGRMGNGGVRDRVLGVAWECWGYGEQQYCLGEGCGL
jgi:hypothetical protein